MPHSNSGVIVSLSRVPLARQNGPLSSALPVELAALAIRGAVSRSAGARPPLDTIHWGVMYQPEGNSVYLPRFAALQAGLGDKVPCVMVNRFCGSGLEALIQSARAILLGEAQFALAGSSDNVSRAASLKLQARREMRNLEAEDPVSASTLDPSCGRRMSELADSFARQNGIPRTHLDAFAFESRLRAAAAVKRPGAHKEIVPVPQSMLGPSAQACLECDQMEARWPTLADLEVLPSPFGNDGRVTRGNSSAFADGAFALVLASERTAARAECPILARVRAWAVAAADPAKPGEALVVAILTALKNASLSLDAIDHVEIEEAFAVYSVYAARTLSIPARKINPRGGALAFGHAPASSGLWLISSVIAGFAEGASLALAALCLGAGQAMAIVLDNGNLKRRL